MSHGFDEDDYFPPELESEVEEFEQRRGGGVMSLVTWKTAAILAALLAVVVYVYYKDNQALTATRTRRCIEDLVNRF